MANRLTSSITPASLSQLPKASVAVCAHDAGAATAAGKERGTRSKRAGKFTAVEDLARYSVEDAQDAAAAGKEGDKEGCRRRGGDKE